MRRRAGFTRRMLHSRGILLLSDGGRPQSNEFEPLWLSLSVRSAFRKPRLEY